jgi:hypothetical protein
MVRSLEEAGVCADVTPLRQAAGPHIGSDRTVGGLWPYPRDI